MPASFLNLRKQQAGWAIHTVTYARMAQNSEPKTFWTMIRKLIFEDSKIFANESFRESSKIFVLNLRTNFLQNSGGIIQTSVRNVEIK